VANACADAVAIPAAGGVILGDTSTAGPASLRGSCSRGVASKERVYVWVPETSGTATISTCGAATHFDTVLHMRTTCAPGVPSPPSVEVACVDDACPNSSGQILASRFTTTVTAGTPYYIIVDGYDGASGAFRLKVEPPSSGTCSQPIVLPAAGGVFNGTTAGTGALAGACAAGSAAAPEVVYQWTAATSGSAVFETCGAGTNFDTVVYLREGVCASGTQAGCNDDACANATGAMRASRLTRQVTAGESYFLVVDGYNGAAGTYTLRVTPP
jgi:hypothetical protein